MLKFDKISNYPNSMKIAMLAAIKLGMTPQDLIRYLIVYTKNARRQLGLPEKFYFNKKIMSFKTNMNTVYFRDNYVDAAALVELAYSQYAFSKVDKNGAFIDVGAGTGIVSKIFSFYNPSNRIMCFEPVIENAEIIKLNCPKAEIYEYAIGRKRKNITFYIHPVNSMAFKNRINTDLKRRINVFPLDFFTDQLENIAALKIDTEGSEVDVLLGAKKTLRRTDEIKMETHSVWLHQKSKSILIKNGFSITKDILAKNGFGLIFAEKIKK